MSSHSSKLSHSSTSSGNERNPLYKAAKTGSLAAVKAQVRQAQEYHVTAQSLEKSLNDGLKAAIEYKHPSVISYLLDHGAKLTPGMVEYATAEDTPIGVFETFLNHGWDINEPIANGSPVLKYVVPNAALVRWLLSHGANPNKRGFWNELPVTVACGSSTPEVVDLLLAHGASLHHSNALQIVADDDENRLQSLTMISHLLDLGMDVNELSHDMYPESRGLGDYTPLHAAAGSDFAEAIILLLQRGADPEIKNTLGKTSMDWAIECGNAAAIEALSQRRPGTSDTSRLTHRLATE